MGKKSVSYCTLAALFPVLLFFYAEIATSAFQPHWMGGTANEWMETIVVLFSMSALACVCIALLEYVLSLVPGKTLRRALPELAAVLVLAGMYVLGFLEPGILFAVLLGGSLLLCLFSRWISKMGYAPYCTYVALGIPLVSATLTLCLASRFFFLNPNRGYLALSFSLATLITALLSVGWKLALARNRRHPLVAVIPFSLLICGALPAILYILPEIEARMHKSDPGARNLLLVTADALRADWCSAYGGHIPTPTMEAMAAHGVRFDRCYSLAPYTMPSLSGLFASKYPLSHSPGLPPEQRGLESLSMPTRTEYWLDEQGKCFPQRASERIPRIEADGLFGPVKKNAKPLSARRQTAVFLANPAFFPFEWLNRSFDQQIYFDSFTPMPWGRFQLTPRVQACLARWGLCDVRDYPPDTTRPLVQYTKAYLRLFRNRPFFLWVHLFDPHAPYNRVPPNPFIRSVGLEFKNIDISREEMSLARAEITDKRDSTEFHPQSYLENEQYIEKGYDAAVRYTDWALSQIYGEYTRLSLDTDTYFFFSSDHGESFGEHGQPWPLSHGLTMYDEELHVPLLAVGPGLRTKAIPSPVSHIDLVPTFADLLAVAPAATWKGRSLRTVLTVPGTEPDWPVYSQGNEAPPLQMVADNDLKLIRNLDTGDIELYDILDDAQEKTDLQTRLPNEAMRLKNLLDEFTLSFPYCYAVASARSHFGRDSAISEEFRTSLEAMGYLR